MPGIAIPNICRCCEAVIPLGQFFHRVNDTPYTKFLLLLDIIGRRGNFSHQFSDKSGTLQRFVNAPALAVPTEPTSPRVDKAQITYVPFGKFLREEFFGPRRRFNQMQVHCFDFIMSNRPFHEHPRDNNR